MSELDYKYNDNAICPYCNYEDVDSWEFNQHGEEQDVECGNCGKEYHLHVEYSTTYSTYKKDEA